MFATIKSGAAVPRSAKNFLALAGAAAPNTDGKQQLPSKISGKHPMLPPGSCKMKTNCMELVKIHITANSGFHSNNLSEP